MDEEMDSDDDRRGSPAVIRNGCCIEDRSGSPASGWIMATFANWRWRSVSLSLSDPELGMRGDGRTMVMASHNCAFWALALWDKRLFERLASGCGGGCCCWWWWRWWGLLLLLLLLVVIRLKLVVDGVVGVVVVVVVLLCGIVERLLDGVIRTGIIPSALALSLAMFAS